MKNIEKQKKNVSELLKLVKENTDLEIIPMVETDVVCSDDYSTWAGNWGKAEIDEYYNSDERIYFKSHDFDELVQDILDNESDSEFYTDDEVELAEQKVNNLPWIKAIIVNITT